MSRTLEVIISTTGETNVMTKGFSGASCRDASRFIEQALGQRISESLTAEFHQMEVTAQAIRQQG